MSPPADPVTLYMFPGSNAVLTARLMLAHKGIAHRRVDLPPGVHAPVLLAMGYRDTTVPAMRIGGRRVQGSRRIARALDELVGEPPLFPADPARRAEVEEVERWGEAFQNAARRIFYCIARRDQRGYREVLLSDWSPRMRRALGAGVPLLIRVASVRHRAADERGRADLAHLPEHLDRIDAWIAAGLLDGPQLNAADFQIAPNLAAFAICEDTAPYLRGRPAQALADRVAPGYCVPGGVPFAPGAVPAALPADWRPVVEAARSPAPMP